MARRVHVPYIQGADQAFNRFQAAVIEALRVLQEGAEKGVPLSIPVFTTATAPEPSATWQGQYIRVHDAGSAEQIWFCLRDADGQWAWFTNAGSGGGGFGPLYPLPGI